MDITPIINQLLSVFWYLIPLAIIAGIFKSPWFKGVFGEFQVNLLLNLSLDKATYHLIKNVTLPTQDGTTQIDHILVSCYGVFVIETKNMKGWIFGSTHQKQWTQRIFKHSSKFQNPIHQNYKHLKTLESCLDIPVDCLFSVIVFIGDSTFKTPMPDNVTYARGFIQYIKSKGESLLNADQVRATIDAIESDKLKPSFKTNREHVAHVKQIIKTKRDDKVCPKCGAGMVVREAKRGPNAGNTFWGCSTYPQCRSIINVS